MVAAAALVMGVQAARAGDFVGAVPVVHVTVPAVESRAQQADSPREPGFAEIVLSDAGPAFAAPPAELNPVRARWNGAAVKDGQAVEIYADLR